MSFAASAPARLASPSKAGAHSLIYTFFFVSGMPALLYQLAWQHELFRIFGLSMDSVTVIVTAFMLGLGAGSFAGSFFSARRIVAPLPLVCAIELAIGAFGLFSLSMFGWVNPFVQDMTVIERSVATIALLFVPTALMGATLPLLIGHLVSHSESVGLSAGSLYRVNALGAVAGCILGAVVLFPFLGLQKTIFVAAALNALVAAVALAAHRRDKGEAQAAFKPARPSSRAMKLGMPAAGFLVLFSGFVSLSFEIFLLHLTSFVSQTSATYLTCVLAAFLLGIASGAQEASEWSKRGEKALSPGLCRTLLTSAVAGLAILPILNFSAALGLGMVGIIAAIAFLVARSLGAVFPLVADLAVPPDADAGREAGLLYFCNIAGAAAGSFLTGFVLCDVMGIRALALLLSGLGLLAVVPLVWKFAGTRAGLWQLPALAAVLAVLQLPLTGNVIASMLYQKDLNSASPITATVENRYGIIAVARDGSLFGGGAYDGHFNTDLLHDNNRIVRAYSLSLFHAAPREVFMIGLASASWAQAIAANPDVRHLTVVEINPGYLQLIAREPAVASVLHNPKVTIVIDDGNRWLLRHPGARYDVIVANTTYFFRSNASTLLSKEFNRSVAGHLNKGGLYLYNTTGSNRVQQTACESFAGGYRFFNLMVMSDTPFQPNLERWQHNLLETQVGGRPALGANPASGWQTVTADLPLETCASVVRRTGSYAPITADNMGSEWRWAFNLE